MYVKSLVLLFAPRQLAQTRTSADGRFTISADGNGAILYMVAKGGHLSAKPSEISGLLLMAVLGSTPPANLVVNELTTVAFPAKTLVVAKSKRKFRLNVGIEA